MTSSSDVQTTSIDVTGPYDLAEVALMGFGHRDEQSFDGVMRMAFCLDGDHETAVGVAARQVRAAVELTVHGPPGASLTPDRLADVARQVARVISLDHDGAAFDAMCTSDLVLARLHAVAPGFRPALFYSPYEAAVWSVVSARRARGQGITLRTRLCELYGTPFLLAGQPTAALPTPSQLLAVESVPGLPADRVPRLHAIARAATEGRLGADRLRALDPAQAELELQQLPGIGPFYSSLIVLRACGHADVLAFEGHARSAVEQLYGVDHELSPEELTRLAESWRPFRTWVMVSARALGAGSPRHDGPVPEGDTVWRSCRRLDEALAGHRLTRCELRVPALATTDLTGVTVLEVVSRGKHQLFRFDNGYTLHTHFRMEGTWRIFERGRRWSGGQEFQIRAVLATARHDAVGYRLPVVELLPTVEEDTVVGHLGPDLLGPGWDLDEAVRRVSAQPERTIGEALLDQRLLAGIGTLYRSELLFLQGIHPRTPVGSVADLRRVLQRGQLLLHANRWRAEQSTTGDLRAGRCRYVFERPGQPCRRCGTPVLTEEFGPKGQERRSYWCPRCQPAV